MEKTWKLNPTQLQSALGSNLETGLTESQVQEMLARFGPNQLQEREGTSAWKLFLLQFNNFIVWVLVGAALVSGFLSEWADAIAILIIVILNSALGFIQEFKAEKSLAALRKLASPVTKVVRDGSKQTIASAQLVPGDLVELEAGDFVPADGRIVWTTANFGTQEASLTGESLPVSKDAKPIEKDEVPLAERHNMVFMGTAVVSGRCRALLVHTGMNTELGKIAGMLQTAGQDTTPLQKRLEEFGKFLVYACFGIVLLVFIMEMLRGNPLFDTFLIAVSLAVAAIPEGLPAVVTIALALGVQRMVKRHALIRRLPSVETLGSATVICSDKTGTLTKNEMTVLRVHAGDKLYEVTGIGYAPTGAFQLNGQAADPNSNPDLAWTLQTATLCNGAELCEESGKVRISGDPTEAALLTAAAKAGIRKKDLEGSYPFVEELPFDSERKRMTVVRKAGAQEIAFIKGAPDLLLGLCTKIRRDGKIETMDSSTRTRLLEVNDSLSSQAMRVLGVAYRELEPGPTAYTAEVLEKDLVFSGFMAMIDPPREEVKTAVAHCKTAGIRVVMITGDHKNTAMAIAHALGIMEKNSLALTGAELDQLGEAEFEKRIESIAVYARVSPENKLRIVKGWRKKGHVVAMTGDGVNDAPAVREADIGVSMGITGTDVTKEVSDMVVTDDNFASIVSAVEEGRGIYDNIQKFIHYLLSCNAGEILLMFLAALIGIPIPLLPIQILWINLITDGLPALALGVDPVDKKIMQRKPRVLNESVITRRRMGLIAGQGLVIAAGGLLAFTYMYYFGRAQFSEVLSALYGLDFGRLGSLAAIPQGMEDFCMDKARTFGFIVLAFSQDVHSYNCRNQNESLFKIGFLTNKRLIGATTVSLTLNLLALYSPFLQTFLHTVPLTAFELAAALLLASLPFWFMESLKLGMRGKRIL